MTTPVSQHLIVDPATLIYENFTTVQLTTILTELGEKDLSKKKRVLFDGYRKLCQERRLLDTTNTDLLLDPSFLKENQYNRRGLLRALRDRKVSYEVKNSSSELFQKLLAWATGTWPQTQGHENGTEIQNTQFVEAPHANSVMTDPTVTGKRPAFSASFQSPAKQPRTDRFTGRFASPTGPSLVTETHEDLWMDSFGSIFPFLGESANTEHLEPAQTHI
jgi:hypothetical protein